MPGIVLIKYIGENRSLVVTSEQAAAMVAKVGGSAVTAEKDLAKFAQTAGNKLAPGLTSSVTGLQGLTTGASSAALGVAGLGVAVGALLEHGVQEFMDLTDNIRQVQRVTGGTAEESSALAAVMHRTGIEVDAGSRAFFQLSKNVELHGAALRAQGVQVAKDHQGHVDLIATLGNVADAYQHASDKAQANTLAGVALGKGGMALLPLLGKTKDEINAIVEAAQKHHEWVTDDDLAKTKALKVAMKELGDAATGLEIEASKNLIPAITKFADVATSSIENVDDLADHVGGLSNVLKAAFPELTALLWAADQLGLVADHSNDIIDKAVAAFEAQTKATNDDAGATANLTARVESHTRSESARANIVKSSTEALTAARSAQADATRTAAEANDAAASSATNLWNAQLALNDALKPATADEQQAAANGVEHAYIGLGDAMDAVTKAQHDLAEAQAHGGEKETAAEVEKVADAHRTVIRDTQQVTRAQQDVARSMKGEEAAARGVADALRHVEQATHGVEDANQGFRDSAFDLEEAERKVAEATAAVAEADATGDPKRKKQAQDDLRLALHARADATDKVRQAENGITDAQQGVADAQQGVKDAQDKVTEAHQSTLDAIQSQRDAQADLNGAVREETAARKALAEVQAQAHSDAVRAAQREVLDATLAQSDATLALHDAQQRQNETTAQGTNFDPEVVRQRQAVRQATLDLAESQRILAWDTALAANATNDLANAQARRTALVDRPLPAHLGSADSMERSVTNITHTWNISGLIGNDRDIANRIRAEFTAMAKSVGANHLFG